MKILIDAQTLQWHQVERGLGKFTASFIKSMMLNPNIDVHILISDNEYYQSAYDILKAFISHEKIHIFEFKNGKDARDAKIIEVMPDVYHILDPLYSFVYNEPFQHDKIKCIATLHDLIVLKYASQYEHYYETFVEEMLQKITHFNKFDHIITLTNHVKEDLIRMTNMHYSKITVCSSSLNLELLETQKSDISIHSKFILYVGGEDYRKNTSILLKAYEELPKQVKDEYSLVLVGAHNSNTNVGNIFRINASDNELISLYKNASLFVFPSLDEGFGMPLVEAMHNGCPLICSDTKVSREIVGDIDCYFDPTSYRSLQKKILSYLYNPLKLEHSKKHGLETAKYYNWDNVIMNNIRVYESVL